MTLVNKLTSLETGIGVSQIYMFILATLTQMSNFRHKKINISVCPCFVIFSKTRNKKKSHV